MNGTTLRRWLASVLFLIVPIAGNCEMKVVGESAEGYFGKSPEAELARAAAEGRTIEVKRLLEAGAQVNRAGKQNMTPLAWALTARNVVGMRALLEAGADPHQRIGPEKQFHLVWLAAGQDDPRQLELLLQFGGDPNARHTGFEYAPLVRAVTNLANVELLVRAGADINVANSLGSPFVLQAASLGQYDIVMFALRHGFRRELPLLAWEINDRRPDGRAPVPAEFEAKRLQVLAMLRDLGVTPPPGKAPQRGQK